MNDQDLAALKERLEAVTAGDEEKDRNFKEETTSELSVVDNHPGDTGTELFEREKDTALHEHRKLARQDAEAALARIEAGTYGYCTVCGEEIKKERLFANPSASECIEHAGRGEDWMHRPVEEEVQRPFSATGFIDEAEDHTYFDAEDTWNTVARYGASDDGQPWTKSRGEEDSENMDGRLF
ncbi:TraR/DksA family transcriptional regulator [Salsuginibacillus halophilus]|uniref:TraR/DksA family transcriptional regulator n=1 Tax=Salsuginibacillus halophilus TaxID=517424 RepID=A0A2P8HDY5_9BACI|nr:TraR/DksA C4-type zinc finger protein [Salsuginibacillus halophilus]PSL44402.1 TraR/DksA family transcriptional regulator [Salsuginibacillus halophilus]